MDERLVPSSSNPIRRAVCALLTAAVVLVPMTGAFGQPAYPSKTMTLVVPGPPGGVTDQLGRLIAARVGERMGQSVIVENRVGAGGNLAAESVARAEPNGYTVLMGTQGTQATNQYLYKSLPFDPAKDFVAVHGLLSIPNILVANASRPYRTVAELVSHANQNPGKVLVSSAGNGTGTHLAAELFQAVAGVRFVHVPYKGSVPSINDLLGGQVDISFDYPVTTLAQVQAGKLRALAVTGAARLPTLPEVPTIAESGYPAAESTSWIGLFFPAKTPAAIVQRWQAEVAHALEDAAVVEALGRMGGVPLMLGGARFEDFITAERSKWETAVRRSGAAVN